MMKALPINEIVRQVKGDVAYDRLEEGLQKLKGYIEEIDDELYLNQVILLMSRLENLKKQKIKNTLDTENINLELNRIRNALLDMLDNIRTYLNDQNQLKIIRQNQNDIADLKAIFTKLNIEVARETISRLGECWSEIYQFERDFQKVNNEFVRHYLDQHNSQKLDMVSQMELEINNMFPIPPMKTEDEKKEIEEKRKKFHQIIKKAYSPDHQVSSKEQEYFSLKFKKLFEKFDLPDSVLERNRFWLQRDLYSTAREYHNCYLRFIFFFSKQNYPESYICLKKMDSEKASIEKIILDLNLNFGMNKL